MLLDHRLSSGFKASGCIVFTSYVMSDLHICKIVSMSELVDQDFLYRWYFCTRNLTMLMQFFKVDLMN